MRERALRRILVVQGIYYAATGLWAAIAFDPFRAAVGLPINHFQAAAFAALAVPLGAALALAGLRDGSTTRFAGRLGAAVAACLALTELIWLPRFGGVGALWLDLPIELAFALLLGWLTLRPRAFDDPRPLP